MAEFLQNKIFEITSSRRTSSSSVDGVSQWEISGGMAVPSTRNVTYRSDWPGRGNLYANAYARWSGVPPMASFLTLLKSMWSCAIKFAPICLCFSSLCYLSSPCKLIVYCYEHIVCFDSAQFDALLDNFECIYCICPSAVFCINNSILFYSILFHHFSQLGLGCLLHFINTSRESKMTSWPRTLSA